jgi:hypothetical protein
LPASGHPTLDVVEAERVVIVGEAALFYLGFGHRADEPDPLGA